MLNARNATGFTLLELMITIAIMTIVSAFAVPSFQWLISLNRLSSEANELIAGMNTARIEAIRSNARGILCRASVEDDQVDAAGGCVDDADGSWAGWMVFVDADGSGSYNPDADANPNEALVRTHVFRGNRLRVLSSEGLAAAGNRILYRPDGLARAVGETLLQTAVLRVCEPSPSMSDNARDVRLGGGSRIGVTRATTSGCTVPGDA